MERERQLVGRHLGGGVRRLGVERVRLADGQGLGRAVDLARRRVDQASDAGAAGRLEHVERAADVGVDERGSAATYEYGIAISAARWNTTSTPSVARSTTRASRMSPNRSVDAVSDVRRTPRPASRPSRASCRGRTRGRRRPRRTRRSTRWLPMKPSAPVTRTGTLDAASRYHPPGRARSWSRWPTSTQSSSTSNAPTMLAAVEDPSPARRASTPARLAPPAPTDRRLEHVDPGVDLPRRASASPRSRRPGRRRARRSRTGPCAGSGGCRWWPRTRRRVRTSSSRADVDRRDQVAVHHEQRLGGRRRQQAERAGRAERLVLAQVVDRGAERARRRRSAPRSPRPR